MGFEWDEAKRAANIEKHGIDFTGILSAFSDDNRLTWEDARRDYGEPRFVSLAMVEGLILTIVYTRRNDSVRLISARMANRNERERYER